VPCRKYPDSDVETWPILIAQLVEHDYAIKFSVNKNVPFPHLLLALFALVHVLVAQNFFFEIATKGRLNII
jgi:hypothetical protein